MVDATAPVHGNFKNRAALEALRVDAAANGPGGRVTSRTGRRLRRCGGPDGAACRRPNRCLSGFDPGALDTGLLGGRVARPAGWCG